MVIELQNFQPVPILLRNTISPSSSYLYKQSLAAVTSSLLCLCGGFAYGHSAVLVPQVKVEKIFPYDEYYDSWIASSAPLAMIFASVFSGVLMDKLGRKYTQILLIWPFLIGFLTLAFASSIVYLLVGRILTGMCAAVFRSIGSVYLSEVSDPATRPIFQFFLSTSSILGILVGHIIGSYLSVRNSCLIFTIPILMAFILLIFMKESPLWLISVGKVDEGEDSFNWYRCGNEAGVKELAEVLEKQNVSPQLSFMETLSKMFSKKFSKAFMIGFFIFASVQFSGVNNFAFYAQDLLKPTFSGKIDAFLLMILVDCLRFVGTSMLLPLLRYCPRRKSYFIIGGIVVTSLIGIVTILVIGQGGLIWLLLTCLIIFMTVGSLLISLAWTFVAEIFPDEIRGIGSGLSLAVSFLLLFISVKITPGIVANFGLVTLYSTFAFLTSLSLVILFFLLPDTDGKSLFQIEKDYDK